MEKGVVEAGGERSEEHDREREGGRVVLEKGVVEAGGG